MIGMAPNADQRRVQSAAHVWHREVPSELLMGYNVHARFDAICGFLDLKRMNKPTNKK
jgi:hypothetical protein